MDDIEPTKFHMTGIDALDNPGIQKAVKEFFGTITAILCNIVYMLHVSETFLLLVPNKSVKKPSSMKEFSRSKKDKSHQEHRNPQNLDLSSTPIKGVFGVILT